MKSEDPKIETFQQDWTVNEESANSDVESSFSTPNSADRILVELGYEAELKREFTMFSAFSFAVSISGLMATIGTTFYYPLEAGGAAATVWCWVISGFGCLCISFSVAEIVSAYPTSGGMYYACSKVFPESWAPVMCWCVGYLNLLGQIAGVASSDYGAAQMLLSAVQMNNPTYTPTANHTVGVMAAILVFHGLINSFPTKYLERLANFYVVFHFGCLFTGAIALLAKTHDKHDASYVFTHIESNSGWTPLGFSFLFGFLSVSWTMTDYDATAHICEEMKEPERKAPWAISVAMVFTYVLGILYNIVLAFCMGDPIDILNSSQPVAQIYYNSLGKGGGIFYTVAMFIIMNFVGVSALHATSRTTWAQARDKMLPFSRIWYRVNKTTKTPLYSVWLNTAMCIAINLIALGSTTTINAIFNVCAIALDWSYIVPILGKMFFPHLFKKGPWTLGRFSYLINGWASLWTLFVSVIFFLPTNIPVTAQNMNYAVAFFFGILIFSIVFWHLGGKKKYRGPQATAPDADIALNIDVRGEVKDEKLE